MYARGLIWIEPAIPIIKASFPLCKTARMRSSVRSELTLSLFLNDIARIIILKGEEGKLLMLREKRGGFKTREREKEGEIDASS